MNAKQEKSSVVEPRRRGRPRLSEASDTRGLLKLAATTCFGTVGYEATSVAVIAKTAGVAPTAVYHHFGTKEALWEAVFLDALDAAYRNFEQMLLSRPTFGDALNYFLAAPGHVSVTPVATRELLIRCASDMRVIPALEKYRVHRRRSQDRVFSQLVDFGYETGEISKDRDRQNTLELVRMVIMGNLWESYTHPDEQEVRTHAMREFVPELLTILKSPTRASTAPGDRKAG
ncbi:MAG: hypothetical protein RLZZ199_350 [Actinomycetota bacterium]